MNQVNFKHYNLAATNQGLKVHLGLQGRVNSLPDHFKVALKCHIYKILRPHLCTISDGVFLYLLFPYFISTYGGAKNKIAATFTPLLFLYCVRGQT